MPVARPRTKIFFLFRHFDKFLLVSGNILIIPIHTPCGVEPRHAAIDPVGWNKSPIRMAAVFGCMIIGAQHPLGSQPAPEFSGTAGILGKTVFFSNPGISNLQCLLGCIAGVTAGDADAGRETIFCLPGTPSAGWELIPDVRPVGSGINSGDVKIVRVVRMGRNDPVGQDRRQTTPNHVNDSAGAFGSAANAG